MDEKQKTEDLDDFISKVDEIGEIFPVFFCILLSALICCCLNDSIQCMNALSKYYLNNCEQDFEKKYAVC